MVREKHLDVGFAFDGDADRCIAVDENGNIVDGDAILYILAKSLKKNGALRGDKIALTVMSNSGLIRSLSNEGIGAEITAVGDRFVYDRMQEMDLSLGGEQSGHIIISDLGATGDGILAAILLADEMIDNKRSLT
jgi:phosphoglucosamine mutase